MRLLSIFQITIACIFSYNLLYADTQGNIVRDVPGASVAVFRCADGEILKFEVSNDPPGFMCSADATGGGGASGYDTVKEESSALTQRSVIKFVGASITCADSGGETVCTATDATGGVNALLDATNHTDTTASSVTRGDLIIGNSTPAWDDLAIGTDGYVLTSDGTDPSWQPPGDSPYDDSDNTSYIIEEFYCRASTNTLACGEGWETAIQNSAQVLSTPGSLGDGTSHPGQLQLSTSTNATGRVGMALGFATTTVNGDMVLGGGEIDTTYIIRSPSSLSSLADRYTIRIGFMDLISTQTQAAGPTRGIWVHYSDDVNSGKWQCNSTDGGTTESADSSVTVATSTWYKIRILVNAAGTEAEFFINGSSVCTLSDAGDLPNDNNDFLSAAMFIGKGTGNNVRAFIVDFFKMRQEFTTPR